MLSGGEESTPEKSKIHYKIGPALATSHFLCRDDVVFSDNFQNLGEHAPAQNR
jgi:hypothetical protein